MAAAVSSSSRFHFIIIAFEICTRICECVSDCRSTVSFTQRFVFAFVHPRQSGWGWRWWRHHTIDFICDIFQYTSMRLLIECAERNVVFVIGWCFVVDLLFTQSHAILCLLRKFVNFVHLQQIGSFLVWNFRRCIDTVHACNRMLENELDVFEQLP